ncbi:glycosyltransferase family 4 protein [Rhodovulum sp. ES.010]|uniref:glycosyltransferase family 4 protein n=1 Tax=Rhodovulum sp. ES.010 TaxID=1882821 RepID=UPI0020C9C4AC|nr:glycosyltransferase family 4 protein [Rhodovulum sp. ES.010]
MSTQGVGDAWVGNELRVVARAGIPFRLHALTRPAATYFSSADIAEMERGTRYLYPVSGWRVARDVLAAPGRFGRRFFAALGNALTGERESLRNRLVGIWHLAVACHWAATLRDEEVSQIHSQWIHSGGTVAMYGAWLLGVPFSFTGHAADLFRNRSALADKIRRAAFIICISEFHRDFFLRNGARPEQLHIAYCGLDTSHFSPRRRVRPEGAPWHILSAGRLVEKKGFPVLIRACEILKGRGVDFTCTIGGSGPDEAALRAQIAAAGLGDRITLTGTALKQEDIPAFMETGDVFCLPCVWASDNDVDGLPQMLMEAMACGLPAVSTRLVGIPDLVRHEETGLLVESGDAEGLAEALMRLERDPALADRLAEASHAHLLETFDLRTCLEPLLSLYRAALEART